MKRLALLVLLFVAVKVTAQIYIAQDIHFSRPNQFQTRSK